MQIIIAIITMVVVLITLRLLFHTSVDKIKQLSENEKLNKLTDVFPDNIEIGKKILSMLGNKTTKIEEDDKTDLCLYLVMTDKIAIANLKNKYTRIQTIAHECIHSMQDKKNLWFHFIFSNLYLIYFAVITLLVLLGIVQNIWLHAFLLCLFGLVYYMVRSYLETDAMVKARYLAKAYMRTERLIKPEEVEEIVGNYDVLNKIGVQYVNYNLIFNILVKIIIFMIVAYFKIGI